MLHQTRGIVFKRIKYADTSIICQIYTEEFGLQSYIVKGVRKAKAKIKANLFQQLNLLDLIVYHKDTSKLQNIREIRLAYNYSGIFARIDKSSVLLFINEILIKTIKEEEPNPELFNFIYDALIQLDKTSHPANFHIYFMLRLSKHLGFSPRNNFDKNNKYFSLTEGEFEEDSFPAQLHLSAEQSTHLYNLISQSHLDFETLKTDNLQRRELLNILLLFYEQQVPGFKNIKSYNVLQQVFNQSN